MADIKGKDMDNLADWNSKELRKLKILINNRMQSFQSTGKVSELKASHPLSDFGAFECENLLKKVALAEKNLKN